MCTSQLSKWNCSRNDSTKPAPTDENLVKKLNLEIVTGEHPCRSAISIKVFTLQWILFHKIWS